MKPEIRAKGHPWPPAPSVGAREGRYRPAPAGSAALAGAERKERFRPDAKRHAPIRVTRRFGASAECVFHAWLDPDIAGRWLFATASRPMARVDIDARVAGSFRFVGQRYGESIEYSGEYLRIIPHHYLAFTLSTEDHPRVVTCVMVEVTPLNNGCALTLTHENVLPEYANHTKQRWTGILYGLAVMLDSHTTS